ncbi:MAG: hypothetical protein WDW36_001934 [Sanguina aurantia]
MGYVPPHLRDGAVQAAPSSSAGGGANGSSFGGGNSSAFGARGRDASFGSGVPRSGSNQNFGDGPSRSNSTRPVNVEPVFVKWQPSDRMLSLNAEQIIDIRSRLNVVVEVPAGQPDCATPIESFKEMNLHQNILTDIASHKYETPTPIQAQGIPIALSGRDILGCAETGSGKTASFAIPMIQHCLNQAPLRPGDGPIGLVLAPTRELAQQIEREVKAFSTSSRNVRTAIVVGGVQMGEQRHDLRSGVEIIVATPGRFIDHLQQGNTNLSRVSFVVLDEADRMLDMGFEPQIKEVMHNLPTKHQTLLFSATMPKEIEELAVVYLTHPVTAKIGAVSTPTANVAQTLEHSPEIDKLSLLIALLMEENSSEERGGPPMPLTIVFVERKSKCDGVAQALREEGLKAQALHGGLSQNDRESALRDFTRGVVKVLVATDVASRGLDIKGIGHVVNMDLPKTFEDYVHRVGRTGRAGSKGRATSFWSDRDSFLVSQIKQALIEMEKGNGFTFASGKEARKAEKLLALEFKSNLKMASSEVVQAGSASLKMDSRYAFMATASATAASSGAADAAWDD